MCWAINGHFRGKERNLELTLDRFKPNDALSYICTSKSLDPLINFDALPLSKTETRIKGAVGIKAKGLSARVALQSARLAKKTLDRKFDLRMHDFAQKIGAKYNG